MDIFFNSPVVITLATFIVGLLAWILRRLVRRQPFPLTFDAKVEYVCDGDSLWVRGKYGRVKLRLAGMDAPESEQVGGQASTNTLRQLVDGQRVQVLAVSRDQYGRWVSKIYLNDKDIGLEMIRRGQAWAYRRYFWLLSRKEANQYAMAESRAKAMNRGLWQEEVIETPWHWRNRHRPWATRLVRWIVRLIKRILLGLVRSGRRR